MGSLSNNARKLAVFAGFYKSIQSAGGAIAPAIDLTLVPYMNEFAANWGLLAGSLLIAAPIIFTRVQDSTPLEKDLAFSDETVEEVEGLAGNVAMGSKAPYTQAHITS